MLQEGSKDAITPRDPDNHISDINFFCQYINQISAKTDIDIALAQQTLHPDVKYECALPIPPHPSYHH
jgi:hypothetical protein